MISVAIRLSEDQLDLWLEAVSNLTVVRAVELPAAVLAGQGTPFETRLAANGLRVLHATQLLPAGFVTRLAVAGDRARDVLLAQARAALGRCRAFQLRYLSCDLELEVAAAARLEPAIREQTALVRHLLPVAVEAGQILCIPVRHPPPYPGAREWSLACNLVHEVLHPACRLALNLVPADLEAGFDLAAFLRDCLFHLAVIRIHYEPFLDSAGANRVVLEEWAAVLRRQGFKGCVVFCPAAATADGIRTACRQVDAVAPAFAG
jgi:hypothetical protein